MEKDCEECGEGLYWEDQEICLLGLDVVALILAEGGPWVALAWLLSSNLEVVGLELDVVDAPYLA